MCYGCASFENAGKSNDSQVQRIHGSLSQIPWTIVDVNLAHKYLATLSKCMDVAQHVFKWLHV